MSFEIIPHTYPVKISRRKAGLFPFAVLDVYDFMTLSGQDAPKLTIIMISKISLIVNHGQNAIITTHIIITARYGISPFTTPEYDSPVTETAVKMLTPKGGVTNPATRGSCHA